MKPSLFVRRFGGWIVLLGALLRPGGATAQTLAEALDSPPGWTWTTTATDAFGNPAPAGGEWAGQTAVKHDGVDAARSGVVPLFGTSRLRTESITGPGTVTFWRRHGRAYEQNPFSLRANDSFIGLFLPGGTWQPVAIDFPPGAGSLEFSWYNSDQTGAGPDNHAYVDEVAFIPTTGAPQFLPDPIPDLTVGEGYTIEPPVALMGEKPMRLELTLPGAGFAYSAELAPRTVGMSPGVAGWPFGFFANPSFSGLWSITASNAAGVVARTFNVTVVDAAPHSIWVGGPRQVWDRATLRLTANSRGTAPFSYFWKKDGADLPGQTDQTLVISNFSAGDVATYSVVIGNALGIRETDGFSVSLGADAPVLGSQSGDVDLATWDATALEVQVTGTPPFGTEWRRDGALVQSDSYALDGSGYLYVRGFDGAGVYEFTSTNGLGGVTSAPIVVQQAPEGAAIADAMDNRTVAWRLPTLPSWETTTAGSHDGTDAAALLNSWPKTLRTAVKGPGAISFWWRVDGGTLDFSVNGLLADSLDGTAGSSGWQRVQWSLGPGWHGLEWLTQDWTPAAYLDKFVVLSADGGPAIVSQPQGGDHFDGDTAVLAVEVTGSGPFDYRLFKDDGPTPVQEALAEAATTYAFNVPIAFGAEGAYWIEVTDSQGRGAASDDAVVSRVGSFPTPENVAEAVGQPALFWYYTDYSVVDDSFLPFRPWYRTRQDGMAPGADRSARTPGLNSGELAAIVMVYDSSTTYLTRLRFWARVAGAAFADVFHVSVNGTLETPTPAGTAVGASGETWTAYDLLLPWGYSEVQFEVLATADGVTAWLDQIEFVAAAPPVITQQPVALTLPAGESGGLAVAASSPVPVTYQWFKSGVGALGGQTNDTLTFAPISAGDAGQYFVEVSNDFGITPSATVTVTVTGPRPQITQPLQPQWLTPGGAIELEVAATSSTGFLSYRWFRGATEVQVGSATFTRPNATTTDAGRYRVEVSDGLYTVTSETTVTVSPVLYALTWLPSFVADGFATAAAINNAGVVAGYAGGPGATTAATVWSNAVPRRLTPPDAPSNWANDINDAGDVAGVLLGAPSNNVARWSPPYDTSVAVLGHPAGQPGAEEVRLNDRGEVIGIFFQPRPNRYFTFRYTVGGLWEPLGPLTGVTPPAGTSDDGSGAALDVNDAGVIVGNTGFRGAGEFPTNYTGWVFDPFLPGQRTAMDALNPALAWSADRPLGWLDAVNDLGDIAGRRWGQGRPTSLYLVVSGVTHLLLEQPSTGGAFLGESLNVDAMNNRRELVGLLFANGVQRAALVRDRDLAPGGTPSLFNNFAVLDLNDHVPGGVPGFRLATADDINDAGQIVGNAVRDDGTGGFAFLLTPLAAYAGMPARAVDDLLVRRAGQGVRFSAASLVRNDLGAAPLTVSALATTGAAGGTLTDLGGGWHRYDPPAGPDAPDSFTYTLLAGDGTTATGTVRVLVEAEPPPPQNQLPIQMLPGGQVRVRFVGIPGRTYQVQAAAALNGPWTTVATLPAGPTGLVEYQETPPPGATRFYRMVE